MLLNCKMKLYKAETFKFDFENIWLSNKEWKNYYASKHFFPSSEQNDHSKSHQANTNSGSKDLVEYSTMYYQ